MSHSMELRCNPERTAARSHRRSADFPHPYLSRHTTSPTFPPIDSLLAPQPDEHPELNLDPPNTANNEYLFPSPNERDLLYTFCHDLNKTEFNSVLEKLGLKRRTTKPALIATILLRTEVLCSRGKKLPDCLVGASFIMKFKYFQSSNLVWDKCPDNRTLLESIPEKDRPKWRKEVERLEFMGKSVSDSQFALGHSHVTNEKGQSEQSRLQTPDFSLSEFARLCVLLSDEDECRSAVRSAVGLEMSKSELDAGGSRDSFWAVIESSFNDEALQTKENFRATIEGVNSDCVPPAKRSAAPLKRRYDEARGNFTYYHSKWSQSGQNDPQAFHKLLPRLENSRFTSKTARVNVIFKVCRCGTPNSDTELINISTRVMGDKVSGQSGIGVEKSQGEMLDPTRKKRRSADIESFNEINGSIGEIIEVSKASLRASQDLVQTNEKHVDLTSKLDAQLDLLRKQLKDRRMDEEEQVLPKDEGAWKYVQQMSNFQVSNLMTDIEETKKLMKGKSEPENHEDGSS